MGAFGCEVDRCFNAIDLIETLFDARRTRRAGHADNLEVELGGVRLPCGGHREATRAGTSSYPPSSSAAEISASRCVTTSTIPIGGTGVYRPPIARYGITRRGLAR